jgi:hypothetical protein
MSMREYSTLLVSQRVKLIMNGKCFTLDFRNLCLNITVQVSMILKEPDSM